jgi:hypothetical protein
VNVGKPIRTIVVEPIEDPVPAPQVPSREPVPAERPRREQEPEPAVAARRT